jgi:hypothetical protein
VSLASDMGEQVRDVAEVGLLWTNVAVQRDAGGGHNGRSIIREASEQDTKARPRRAHSLKRMSSRRKERADREEGRRGGRR